MIRLAEGLLQALDMLTFSYKLSCEQALQILLMIFVFVLFNFLSFLLSHTVACFQSEYELN